jgi:NitT/TauT family transport system ATP-binding protein
MGYAIEVINVSKEFQKPDGGRLKVLENVNLKIEDGSFVTILGPSGCGKSTLLSIIGGLLKPNEGEVRVFGNRINGVMPDKVAIVFQDPGLFPWRSVLSNIEFPLELRGVRKEERRGIAMKLIELLGLKGFENYYPNQISGG